MVLDEDLDDEAAELPPRNDRVEGGCGAIARGVGGEKKP